MHVCQQCRCLYGSDLETWALLFHRDHSLKVGKWLIAILVCRGRSEEGNSSHLQVWHVSPPMSPSQWAVVSGCQK